MAAGSDAALAALQEIGVDGCWVDDGLWIEADAAQPETVFRAIQIGRRAAGLPTETYAEWAQRTMEDTLTGDEIAEWLGEAS